MFLVDTSHDTRRRMRKTQNIGWLLVRLLLTAGLAVFCLGAWPGYLFHTYQMTELYTADIAEMPLLSTGEVVQQRFSPADNVLSRIRAALIFDEAAVAEEYVDFTLWNEKGMSLCSRKIYFNNIESGKYFDIAVDTRLKPRSEYVWTLTMPEPTNLQYTVLCTEDVNGNAQENKTLLINGEDTQKNAVNQYEYYAHYDKAVIIGGFWTGAFLVWLLLLELTDRAEDFLERKKENGTDEIFEEI